MNTYENDEESNLQQPRIHIKTKKHSNIYKDYDEDMPLKQNLLEESKSSPLNLIEDDEYSLIKKVDEGKGLKIEEQPMSHEEAKNLCQKMFPKLAEGTKLTKEELEVFYQFKVEQVQTFDHMNERHEVSFNEINYYWMQGELKQLCTALMGLEVLNEIADKDMKDQRWTKFGFQNSNPRTDFRGAGLLGVRNLTYFA